MSNLDDWRPADQADRPLEQSMAVSQVVNVQALVERERLTTIVAAADRIATEIARVCADEEINADEALGTIQGLVFALKNTLGLAKGV